MCVLAATSLDNAKRMQAALLLMVAAACLLLAALAFAAPAQAAGLALEASCPEGGATGVPTTGRLWVRYDHNIAAVEGNAKLAHLTDAAGKDVPKSVCQPALPDFQTEFGYRQYLFFDVKGLDAGATYHIVLDAGMQAKNGSTCEDAVDITFTTAKEGEEAIKLAAPVEKESGTGDGSGGGNGSGSADAGSSSASGGSSSASAKGDIELTSWLVANNASPDEPRPTEMPPSMAHYAILMFSKGVDYYPLQEGVDLSHLKANYAKVSVQNADGTKFEGAKVYSLGSNSEERPGNIYIDLEGRLAPLSEYRIVVEPGITTYSGAYASTQRYEISFCTNGDLGGGLTVAHVLVAGALVIAIGLGIAVQVRHRKQERASARG